MIPQLALTDTVGEGAHYHQMGMKAPIPHSASDTIPVGEGATLLQSGVTVRMEVLAPH